jgi:hypothetical protein
MAQPNRPIQFKVLPRSGEKGAPQPKAKPSNPLSYWAANPMLRNYTIVGAAVIAAFYLLFSDPQPVARLKEVPAKPVQEDMSPEALVNRYLQEADARHAMEARNSELENKATARSLGPDAAIVPDSDRQLGVSLEQENTGEKVYNELYGNKNKGPMTPEDRIDLRLKEDQWMAVAERQERKQYIQNFLKEAYDAGYQIDLDENLVVVRVKRVTSRPKETLDKVLENLARRGY